MKISILLLATLLTLPVLGCKQQEQPAEAVAVPEIKAEKAMVSGTVTYRERMALSDGAVIEVSLQDISLADTSATLIAKQRITGAGQVPIRFEIPYDPQEIDERMTYAIQARITDGEQLLFINDTVAPVLTRGAGNEIDLVLVRVKSADEPTGMLLKGTFRYMADAALFRDCRNNKTYPVSMEGAYIELERAYLNSGTEPGSETMVEIQGRLLQRPAMEGNHNEVKLIVDSFNKLLSEKNCIPDALSELTGTYWRLEQLDGRAVHTPDGIKEAHMILEAAGSGVKGNAGCNSFFGQFDTSGSTLTFSETGSTRMACPHAMETEQAFLAALVATTHYKISGLFLELYAADQVIARFEAMYF